MNYRAYSMTGFIFVCIILALVAGHSCQRAAEVAPHAPGTVQAISHPVIVYDADQEPQLMDSGNIEKWVKVKAIQGWNSSCAPNNIDCGAVFRKR